MSRKSHIICLGVILTIIFTTLIPSTAPVKAASTTSVETEITSQKELIQAVYENMLVRNKNFSIRYDGNWEDVYDNDLNSLLDDVFAIDDKDTSDDFDYLKSNVKKYSLILSSNGITSTFNFTITYRESASQTKKVNTLVAKALKSLNIEDASRYTKVKKIHNYVVNKLTYDTTYRNYTAYTALVKKKAVCQGYALLFYKMATEAGVPCRIVCSDDHAWNIVKMGSKWYHVDTTWDDPISKKPVLRYDYFLKGTNAMSDTHILTAEYTTTAFKKKFPISKTNYKR